MIIDGVFQVLCPLVQLANSHPYGETQGVVFGENYGSRSKIRQILWQLFHPTSFYPYEDMLLGDDFSDAVLSRVDRP